MTDKSIEDFNFGYRECRRVMIFDLRKVLKLEDGQIEAIRELLERLEDDEEADHWKSIQEEFPGITREQYEAELEESAAYIRERYYTKDGLLRLRIV